MGVEWELIPAAEEDPLAETGALWLRPAPAISPRGDGRTEVLLIVPVGASTLWLRLTEVLRGLLTEALRLLPADTLRLGLVPADTLRLGLLPNELLRLELDDVLRLLDILRLGLLLNELLRLGVADILRLGLLDMLRLGLLETLRLGLLTDPRLDDTLRLPPLRCASAGAALKARAAITRIIAFEVFMVLLLSCLFPNAKIQPSLEGFSGNFTYFSPQISNQLIPSRLKH